MTQWSLERRYGLSGVLRSNPFERTQRGVMRKNGVISDHAWFLRSFRQNHAVTRPTTRRTHGATTVTVGNATGQVVKQLRNH